jgi:NAD(P)-dependent dehydrogenase (short-subunit alcohol dehydrogenase family)
MVMGISGPVLVTGASTGIGRCIAETLAKDGFQVYAAARKDADVRTLDAISNIESLKLDVTKETSVDRAAEEIRKRGKGLYGLVNVAGIGDIWPLGELEDEGLKRIFEVNVFGVHRVTRAMLPLLVESGGRIVNIGSIAGLMGYGMRGGYCMTKWAIESYSECLSQELKRYGVCVSVVEPGDYRTKANVAATKLATDRAKSVRPIVMKAEIEDIMKMLPELSESWQKRDTPEKVADAVLGLLRSESPRFRCVVAPSKKQFLMPLDALMARVVQVNTDNEFALSRTELHSLLDDMLNEAHRDD